MRILIIEDQIKLAESIKKGLENIGYAVDMVHDGAKGLKRIVFNRESYDLILLDIMLPELDGISLCKRVREASITIPILMITARDSITDIVEGLDVGADDFLVKPFQFEELTARIRALLRRPQEFLGSEISGAGIELNSLRHVVTKNGDEVKLTSKEFVILEYFLRNKDQVLTRETILAHAWDYEYDAFSNVVDVYIKNLRKKLQKKNENIFETVHGVGYKFNS